MDDKCPKCGGGLVVVTWYTGEIERLCLSCRVEPAPGSVTVKVTTKETAEEQQYRLHLLQRVREFSTRHGWRVNTIYHRISGRIGARINQYTRYMDEATARAGLAALEILGDEVREIESNTRNVKHSGSDGGN